MKRLIVGIIIGLALGAASNAFAAEGDSVTAVFAKFNYVVNGKPQTLDSPVLVHDGNSYLRTTQISNMLGFDVTYKADTRTIEFTNPEPTETPVPTVSPQPTESTGTPPSTSPSTSPSPSPSPSPDNTATCKAIRDNYAGQIAMIPYQGGTQGQQDLKRLQLQHARDQALSNAGCN